MTLITTTYDSEEWQLVPRKTTAEIESVYANDRGTYQTAQELHTAMLRSAPTAPSGWISVEDDCPSFGEECLVYPPYSDYNLTAMYEGKERGWIVFEYVHSFGVEHIKYPKVTHWMPLPTFPTEGK